MNPLMINNLRLSSKLIKPASSHEILIVVCMSAMLFVKTRTTQVHQITQQQMAHTHDKLSSIVATTLQ